MFAAARLFAAALPSLQAAKEERGLRDSVTGPSDEKSTPAQEEDGAKDLALWGVSAFLGTMFGPCLAGPLLAWLGHIPGSDHYSYTGYVALMGCGGMRCPASAVLLDLICLSSPAVALSIAPHLATHRVRAVGARG